MMECEFDDWRTKAAKEARDLAREMGKLPLLSKHVAGVRRMVEIAKKALDQCELGVTLEDFFHAERSVIWMDDGIWKRARFDLQHHNPVHRIPRLLLDYKTVENADPFAFPSIIVNMGYDIQAAHYTDAAALVYECDPDEVDFVFMVQEREPPFEVSFVGVEPMLMELGRQKMAAASRLWKRCLETNKWPGYSRRVMWAAPPAWALAQFESRKTLEVT